MMPFNGACDMLEQHVAPGVVTISAKRHQNDLEERIAKSEQVSSVGSDALAFNRPSPKESYFTAKGWSSIMHVKSTILIFYIGFTSVLRFQNTVAKVL
ncbi:hypothetical protein AXF42_Ash021446 [Apostasia shenzhenica]|uniref:Uncharacterized protein n=1 Tax=Apostasia shenzhenica TaxID=1088818 RepID=A0A2H9ZZL0_9ASPA|nr:hypothetical protein AXF42_Ash021446 [Apostasia shenzhenica]